MIIKNIHDHQNSESKLHRHRCGPAGTLGGQESRI